MIDWLKTLVRDEIARASRRPSPAHVGVVVELAQVREALRVVESRLDLMLGLLSETQAELHEIEERLMLQELETRRILHPSTEAGG